MTSSHRYLYHPFCTTIMDSTPRTEQMGLRLCLCVRGYVWIRMHLFVWRMRVFVCACALRCLKWRSVQQQNCLLSFMPFAHEHKHFNAHRHTRAHTHTPAFIKTSHSVNILCAVMLSAVNGTAAYLQWIVNPAEHSAVRVLWIANMLYLALPIPLYLAPITFIVRWAKVRPGNEKKSNL